MPVILNTKFIYKSSTQLGIKSTAVTSLIGNTAGITFIGGTATTADLSLQTTSGVGTTGADMHFLVGNAGGTEAMTILNSGFVGIGTTSPGAKLEIGSGQIFMPNGTAAAPSLSFTSGTASGLFSPAAQLVSMSIAGTERVRFTGTEIEMSTLALTWGATFNADDVGLSRGAANKLYVGNGTNGDYSGTLIAGNVGIGTADPGSAKLAIMNGNVGIGTTGPGEKVHLYNSTGNTRLKIESGQYSAGLVLKSVFAGDYAVYSNYTDGSLRFAPNGFSSDVVTIQQNGNVGIGVTDPDTKLEVFGSTGIKISFDANDNTTLATDTTGLLTITASGAGVRLPTTSQLQFNDTSTYLVYSGGDLDLYTAANKTLELQTVVYNDICIPLAGAKVPSSNAPTWAAFDTNLNSYTFALNDYTDLATAEILHDYKEGTDIEIHVHFITNGANDGTARKVKYQVFYSWGDAGETMPGEATDSAEETIVASEADRTHHNLSIVTITGTNYKMGSLLKIRLKRIGGTGTEPASDPFVEMVGIHYSVNSLGSRQITTK